MRLVRCISERKTMPGQLIVGKKYWIDDSTAWKDSDGDEYALFYTFHVPSEKYKLGQFKTSHFEIENACTQCIYSTYKEDCKEICMVVKGKKN